MNKTALIVHGKPSKEKYFSDTYPGPNRANWLPWLGEQLAGNGYEEVFIPVIPEPYDPGYDKWIDPLFDRIDRNTLAVVHSFGAAAMMEMMSRDKSIEIGRLIAVAAWFDPNHRYPSAGLPKIDPSIQDRVAEGIDIFYSSKDSEEVLDSVGLMRKCLRLPSARLHNIPEYGHFLLGDTMDSVEFPEIIEVL